MKRVSATIALAFCVTAGPARADFAEEEELALSYGDKNMISITTGMAQPISRAPAVATVITADDIELTRRSIRFAASPAYTTRRF